jgi:hypothetical protein
MTITTGAVVTVQPGGGVLLTSRTTRGYVAIVEHPFAVATITAAHRHTRTRHPSSPTSQTNTA